MGNNPSHQFHKFRILCKWLTNLKLFKIFFVPVSPFLLFPTAQSPFERLLPEGNNGLSVKQANIIIKKQSSNIKQQCLQQWPMKNIGCGKDP